MPKQNKVFFVKVQGTKKREGIEGLIVGKEAIPLDRFTKEHGYPIDVIKKQIKTEYINAEAIVSDVKSSIRRIKKYTRK